MGKKKRTLTPEQQQELVLGVEEATRKVRAAIDLVPRLSEIESRLRLMTERLNERIDDLEPLLASWPDAETDLDETRVLALRSGRLVVDFFSPEGDYVQSLPLLHSPRETRVVAAHAIEKLRSS